MQHFRQIRTDLGWRFAPDRMIDLAQPRPDPALDEVYLKRGLVLIHIPKNAGTSVEDALFGYRVRHRTWREVMELCPRAWAAVPKIAILRDPVDRFLSAFDYLKSGGRNAQDRHFGARMIGGRAIDAFVDQLSSDAGFRATAMRFFHFRPQVDYVCDGSTVMVDTLIPLHHMAAGLARVANLPPGSLRHANKTTGARTQISQKNIDQVQELYAADMALFERVCMAWPDTETLGDGCGKDKG